MSYGQNLFNQKCITVGCVPPTAVAVCLGGGLSTSVYAGTPIQPPRCRPGDPPGCVPGDHPPGCGRRDLQCMLGYHIPP